MSDISDSDSQRSFDGDDEPRIVSPFREPDDEDPRANYGRNSPPQDDPYPPYDPEDSPRPSEAESVVSLTLTDFINMAVELRYVQEDKPAFASFVLTGIHGGIQYQIDPIKDALEDADEIHAMRDFDSLLGIHKDVCVTTYVSLFPAAKYSDTLSRNIHIKYTFSNSAGLHTNIPVHFIPNVCVGKWGTHSLLRVLLPALYNRERKSPFLKPEQLAIFYEKGLRPAVKRLVPISATEWPPTYSAELTRARGKDGKFAFQSKNVASWYVKHIGDYIREALSDNNVPWGEGLVFLHQIRGVKSSSGHTVNRDAAKDSLPIFLAEQHIKEEATRQGEWWIDVGLEISSEDQQCLAWRTDSHFHVVKAALNISDRHADRITSLGSSKYMRDLTSHLTDVAGCRVSPGPQAEGPHQVAYFQMYTTDKALTYRQDGRQFGKYMTGQDILRGKSDEFCRSLYDIYRQASTTNPSLARVEVRVPISQATRVFTVESIITTIRSALVVVDPLAWWSLRAYRLMAFQHILEWQALGDSTLRAFDSALLLTAAAPWFINGLHSTPDNGPASRDLMGKILPLVRRTDADTETLLYPTSTRPRTTAASAARARAIAEEEEEEEEDEEDEDGRPIIRDHEQEDNMSVVSDLSDGPHYVLEHEPNRRVERDEMIPHAPYGIVFLRPIRVGEGVNMPRFLDADVPMVTWKSFQYIFGIRRDHVDTDFFRGKLVFPTHPGRVANRVRRTAIHAPEEPPAPIFNLARGGFSLEGHVDDTGSDIEEGDLNPNDREDGGDIDEILTSLWQQFLVDLTAKAPNHKKSSAGSYCILSGDERRSVTEATYQNLRLSDYFDECQYRIGTRQLWQSSFDKFWPERPVLVKGTQNFGAMTYFIRWARHLERLRDANDDRTMPAMRKVLWKRFQKLHWIPHPGSDRVWYTKREPQLYKKFPSNRDERAAPRVLIRWDCTPTF